MKKLKYLSATLALILLISFSMKVKAHGDIKTLIESRMSWGHSDRLAYLFDEEGVTLELFDQPVSLSVEAAKEKMKKFFELYPPEKCEITSQGKYQDGTRYFNGTYTTTSGKIYKAYFEASLEQDEGHYHISLIRLENN